MRSNGKGGKGLLNNEMTCKYIDDSLIDLLITVGVNVDFLSKKIYCLNLLNFVPEEKRTKNIILKRVSWDQEVFIRKKFCMKSSALERETFLSKVISYDIDKEIKKKRKKREMKCKLED